MGTVAAFTTAAIAKIISDTNVTVAIDELIGNDFAIASGVTVVRGPVSVVGQRSVSSNDTLTVVTYTFDILHQLSDPQDSAAYLHGDAQADQLSLTDVAFWRAVSGVFDVNDGGEPEIALPPDRVGNVIAYSISVTVALEP